MQSKSVYTVNISTYKQYIDLTTYSHELVNHPYGQGQLLQRFKWQRALLY